ncbi:MAG: hypothetical protein JSV30_06230 [Candidatus Omnitrophota bacterium]|nr:MAG: hypothetical protein JSV30_06230 [Candidatus Omnitrophota bacterium]
MKASCAKTIWFKLASILTIGLFLLQGSAFGEFDPIEKNRYNKQSVAPEYDWRQDAIGFATTVAMPFVPSAAGGIGGAFGLGTGWTTAIGVGLGAGVGATPGLVANNDTATGIGAVCGGLTGGLGTYNQVSNFNTGINEVGRVSDELKTVNDMVENAKLLKAAGYLNEANFNISQASSIVSGGTETAMSIGELTRISETMGTMINSADSLGQLGYYNEAAFNLSQAAKIVPDVCSLTTASNLIAMSNAINPLPQVIEKMSISFATQEASSILVKAAVSKWNWNPRNAQALGMIGGSMTGWTMGSLTTGGQNMMYGMYKDSWPGLADWATSDSTWKNVGAGAVTGLGLGGLQTLATMELYDALESHNNKMPDTTKMQVASLGGQALGSLGWGGLVGGFGSLGKDHMPTYDEYIAGGGKVNKGSLSGQGAGPLSKKGFENWVATAQPVAVADKGNWLTGIKDGAGNFGSGMWQGIKTTANEPFWKGIGQRTLSIGIEWAALHNEMDPEDASNLASSTSMLLANTVPMYPHRPDPQQAERLKEGARALEAQADNLRKGHSEVKEHFGELLVGDPLLAMEIDNTFENKIKAFENRAEKTKAQAERVEGWHVSTLREPTPITKYRMLNAFLEPVTSGLLTLAADNLRKGKVEAFYDAPGAKERNDARIDLLVHDLTAMNVASLTHSGIVALFNQKGWGEGFDEFGQIYLAKQCDFSGDMLSFGSQAFGAKTGGRRDETAGGYSIYGAAQRNSQMWDFAGLNNFAAQAEEVADAGGRWQRQMTEGLFASPFPAVSRSLSSPSGGLAYSHTIRNAEGLVYTGIKNSKLIAPYELEHISPQYAFKLEHGNLKQQAMLTEINRWIKESSYPVAFGKEGVNFQYWSIGEIAPNSEKLMLENAFTKVEYKDEDQIMLKALKKFDVNKPFKLAFIGPDRYKQTPLIEKEKIVPPQPKKIVPPSPPVEEVKPSAKKEEVLPPKPPAPVVAPSREGYPIEGGWFRPNDPPKYPANGVGWHEELKEEDITSPPSRKGIVFDGNDDPSLYIGMEDYPTSPKDDAYNMGAGTVFPKGDIENPGQIVTCPEPDITELPAVQKSNEINRYMPPKHNKKYFENINSEESKPIQQTPVEIETRSLPTMGTSEIPTSLEIPREPARESVLFRLGSISPTTSSVVASPAKEKSIETKSIGNSTLLLNKDGLQEFALKHNIPIAELNEVAINAAGTTPEEMLLSMETYAIVKNAVEKKFLSEGVRDLTAEHILPALKSGQILIMKDDVQNSIVKARYFPQSDRVEFVIGMTDLENLDNRENVIHELVAHGLQDALTLFQRRDDVERNADFIAAEYRLRTKGLLREDVQGDVKISIANKDEFAGLRYDEKAVVYQYALRNLRQGRNDLNDFPGTEKGSFALLSAKEAEEINLHEYFQEDLKNYISLYDSELAMALMFRKTKRDLSEVIEVDGFNREGKNFGIEPSPLPAIAPTALPNSYIMPGLSD